MPTPPAYKKAARSLLWIIKTLIHNYYRYTIILIAPYGLLCMFRKLNIFTTSADETNILSI